MRIQTVRVAAPSTNGHTERITLPPQPKVDWEQLRSDAEAIVDRAPETRRASVRQAERKALDLVKAQTPG